MKKAENVSITRLDYGQFYVDIVEYKYHFEAWILEKSFGVSSMMFGWEKRQINNSEWDFNRFVKEVVEPNLFEEQARYLLRFAEDEY